MSESTNRPIDPFRAARRRPAVHVALEIHNVQLLRPEWNDEQARLFLERHAMTIAHTMLLAGGQALRQLMEADKHDC